MLDAESHARFFGELVQGLDRLPGVELTATVNILPLSGNFDCNGIVALDQPIPPDHEQACPEFRTVTPSYAETMQLDLVGGRFIEARDDQNADPVVVINEALARRLWPGEDPIGRQVANYSEIPATVVGVVRDVKYLSLDQPPGPGVYIALDQAYVPWQTSRATVVVRGARALPGLVAGIREQVRALNAALPISDLRTMDAVVSASVASPRFRTLVSASFAALALTGAACSGSWCATVWHRSRQACCSG